MLSPPFTGSLHGKAGSASQGPAGTGTTPGWLDLEEFLEAWDCSQCTSMFWWYLAPTVALQNHKLLGTISRIPKSSPQCFEKLAGPWHFFMGETSFCPSSSSAAYSHPEVQPSQSWFPEPVGQIISCTPDGSIAAWAVDASLCLESNGSVAWGGKTGGHLKVFKQAL